MIQIARFSSGGFVLHRVVINSVRYSAWFDSSGQLIDGERVAGEGKTAAIAKTATKLREQLQKIGDRYKRE